LTRLGELEGSVNQRLTDDRRLARRAERHLSAAEEPAGCREIDNLAIEGSRSASDVTLTAWNPAALAVYS